MNKDKQALISNRLNRIYTYDINISVKRTFQGRDRLARKLGGAILTELDCEYTLYWNHKIHRESK